jgi:hypothetical protein
MRLCLFPRSLTAMLSPREWATYEARRCCCEVVSSDVCED